jgi:hypothetical protein
MPLRFKDYYQLLSKIHWFLKPTTYAEIGVRHGRSLLLAKNARIQVGIDPMPQIRVKMPGSAIIFKMTSDHFFATKDLRRELGNYSLDLGFIDGMHLFEFVLRDFLNLESASTPNSTILLHDSYPHNRITAQREKSTRFWTGDVWKIVLCLKKYRPDLQIATIDVPPSGLTIIRGLNSASTILTGRLQLLYDEYIPMDYSEIESDKTQLLNRIKNDWLTIMPFLRATTPPI